MAKTKQQKLKRKMNSIHGYSKNSNKSNSNQNVFDLMKQCGIELKISDFDDFRKIEFVPKNNSCAINYLNNFFNNYKLPYFKECNKKLFTKFNDILNQNWNPTFEPKIRDTLLGYSTIYKATVDCWLKQNFTDSEISQLYDKSNQNDIYRFFD